MAKLVTRRFQILLVLNRIVLDVLQGHQASLFVKAVELSVRCLAVPNRGKPPRKIDGVMDAAIHAHAAQWIVDVGSVANDKGSPLPEGLGYPLVHFIERDVI